VTIKVMQSEKVSRSYLDCNYCHSLLLLLLVRLWLLKTASEQQGMISIVSNKA